MPHYAYSASDGAGRVVEGVLAADSERGLDHALSEMNLILIDARLERSRGSTKVSPQGLIDLCYHLQSVIEGGIPLVDGLTDLCEDDGNALSAVMRDVVRKLRNGAQLSEAMEEYPRCFPELMRALLRAGEETGRLDVILRDLVAYLEWREELRHQIRKALSYPTVVFLGIGALCVILVTYVLPSFLAIFAELDVELPALTRALLAVSAVLTQHGLACLVGASAVGASAVVAVRTERGRAAYHTALLSLPLAGRLLTMLEMSRLCHNLAILYSAGIPIVRAMEMVGPILQNVRVRRVVTEARASVSRGGSLTEAFSREKLIPGLVMRMLSIGEASGALDRSLERASAYYDRELPRIIARTLAAFNTLAIVFLGVFLAGVAIAIFVPMYQMLGEINAGS